MDGRMNEWIQVQKKMNGELFNEEIDGRNMKMNK